MTGFSPADILKAIPLDGQPTATSDHGLYLQLWSPDQRKRVPCDVLRSLNLLITVQTVWRTPVSLMVSSYYGFQIIKVTKDKFSVLSELYVDIDKIAYR